MKPVNPIKSILYNFSAILGYHKSLSSSVFLFDYVKESIKCFLFHKTSNLELACDNDDRFYRCKCGILWEGRKSRKKI